MVPIRELGEVRFGTQIPTIVLNHHTVHECDLRHRCQIIGEMRSRLSLTGYCALYKMFRFTRYRFFVMNLLPLNFDELPSALVIASVPRFGGK